MGICCIYGRCRSILFFSRKNGGATGSLIRSQGRYESDKESREAKYSDRSRQKND